MGQSNNFHKKYCKNVEKRQHKVSLNFNFFSYCSLLVSLAYSAQAAVRTTQDGVVLSSVPPTGTRGSCWMVQVGWNLALLCSLPPSVNCCQAGCFFKKLTTSVWCPAISLSLLSSGVFSVPEVFLRIGWLSASKC